MSPNTAFAERQWQEPSQRPLRLSGKSKSSVEIRKVADMISKYSVVYPAISFALLNNGKEWYRSPGNSTFDQVISKVYESADPEAFLR